MWPLLAFLLAQAPAVAPPPIPVGTVVGRVACLSDATQSYALYLPPGYTNDRAWPVIFAFDPGGRGATPVERYQQAAARYGYIVAGSNNSRNGNPNTLAVVQTFLSDVASRFHIEPTRVYLAGMSGGARVALGLALSAPGVAGVIASSAGYPDSEPRKSLPFVVFSTAGTEDFNLLELRQLNRPLTTPHRFEVFEGGHVWLSPDLAMAAVGWLDLMAMKRGLLPRDHSRIEAMYADRMADADARSDPGARFAALQSVATDFDGLRDVADLAGRVKTLERDKAVRDALKRERDDESAERNLILQTLDWEAKLGADDDRLLALSRLRLLYKDLAERSARPADSADRRLARRVLSTLTASVRPPDEDYQAIINQYRRGRRQP